MRNWQQLINPKVSVVICNFNYEKFIKSAIDSVLNQTYPAFEIIIVDDGSTDQSVPIIQSQFPDLKLIQKKNQGQISAYNEGFQLVTGDVVLFLDSDDELMPETLARVSELYTKDVVKVQFKMKVMDKDGIDLNCVLPSHLDQGDCGRMLIESGALYKSPPASGNSYRVGALKLVFPLPTTPEEKHGADYFCIYGVSLLGLIASINDPLFKYRVHESGESMGSSLGFGNAVKKHDRQKVMQRRWDMLTDWLAIKLPGNLSFKSKYLDFTQQKFFYAQDILKSDLISQKVRTLKTHIPWLTKAILIRQDFSIFKKIILIIWMLILPILPKKLASLAAKKVCNPT